MSLETPLGVRVLDSQDESAPGAPGEQEIEQGRAGIAQVQLPRWARGEACSLAGTERPAR